MFSGTGTISGIFVDSQDASRRKTAEFPGTRCMTNEPARTCVGADDDDRPLSMWFGGMQHPASVGESSKLLPILIFSLWK